MADERGTMTNNTGNMADEKPIPQIHLLLMADGLAEAFDAARLEHNLAPSISVEVHRGALQFLPSSTRLDLLVSPANSYGLMDGGFDDALSRALAPVDDYPALTRIAQARLYQEWRGFAPPGTCTLLRIPDEWEQRSDNAWGARYVAICPTMRLPQDATWDREVVYECVWSLLCAIDRHNRSGEPHIRSILMTPLATGVGRVSAQRWAQQLVLALNHFLDALERPELWRALTPSAVDDVASALADTWNL